MTSELLKKKKSLDSNFSRLHWKPVILTSYLDFAEEKQLLTFKVTDPRKTLKQTIKKSYL